MDMTTRPTASIIVNNYNYDRYLAETIDSALDQTYPHVEVIVVDDGSTDRSREIIAGYGERIIPVYKDNGGQASALNAGFARSRGDVVIFLDSDDVLYPDAVTNVMAVFQKTDVTKVHWPLRIVDEQGRPTGDLKPGIDLPEGDFRDAVLQSGPTSCQSSPTSGNAWSRRFLAKIFPMPEDVTYYKTCADEYMYTLAPVFGPIKALGQPQGSYRIHGSSIYSSRSFQDKLKMELEGHDQQTAALSRVLRRHGYQVDVDRWHRRSWFHRLQQGIHHIEKDIPADTPFILVDEDTWGAREIFPMRRIVPFIDRDGTYYGPPRDDDEAIKELERIRETGVNYIVIAWVCFWWLEHYSKFSEFLRIHGDCAADNECVKIFELRSVS